MKRITFEVLRAANIARLPRFRNKQGQPAHSQTDGSDWALSTWCNAVLGELGELANLIKKVERGDLTLEAASDDLSDECADVLTYLDILAFRLDIDLGLAYQAGYSTEDSKLAFADSATLPLSTRCVSVAIRFGHVMEAVNWIERCAPPSEPHKYYVMFGRVVMWLEVLATCIGGHLDEDVVEKFNVVSRRVDAGVFITGSLDALAVHVVPR